MTNEQTVAALYVDTARGPYAQIPNVDCWGFASRDGRQCDLFARTRDARHYIGPHSVIAHPPCGPWGRFWWNYKGGEGAKECGPIAVEQVRAFGGVLEHPSQSGLWKFCDLPMPGESDLYQGTTIEVQQCDWGHKARKRTWLYVVGCDIPPLPKAATPTHVMVRLLRNGNDWPEVPKAERHLTPIRFADWLIRLARGASASNESR